jgi:thiol-disulfide isomerase/thioredoxin
MIKKIFSLLLGVFLLLLLTSPIKAKDNPVTIHFFYSKNCPHCAKELIFLKKLVQEYSNVQLQTYGIGQPKNFQFLQKTIQELNAQVSAGVVPFTAIGNQYIVGYLNDEVTGEKIEAIIKSLAKSNPEKTNNPEKIALPLFGEIQTKNFSLPILTILIGFLDGFNPCAMWTLLFLISLLLGMKNRKRMWILGITFIIASSFVYFLFMSAWLNFFLFLGFVVWVRILIGLLALVAGGYNLRDYWKNKDGGCQVVEKGKRQQTFEKIKAITQKKQFWLALGGIILLAFAVNLIELICSAGLPAIYTQILALTPMPKWQYYVYLLLYILVFMLDDLFIFFAAMITLKAVGIESKYARFSKLIGGNLMIIIGLLMLFKPEWLMFG